MPKLFRGAFWVGVTTFVTNIAEKINQRPRMIRIGALVLLNLVGFFCFWIVFYGLGLLLVPPPEQQDYKLMRFGVKFVSIVIALLLSIGLYNFIRGIAIAGKFVSNKMSDVRKGLKDGGRVVVEIPKQAIDATKRVADGAVEIAKNVGVGVGEGIKKGAEVAKETAPVVGNAILTAAQKTGEVVKESAKKTTDWSKENMSKAIQGIKGITSVTFQKAKSLFEKKKANLIRTDLATTFKEMSDKLKKLSEKGAGIRCERCDEPNNPAFQNCWNCGKFFGNKIS